MNSIKLLIVDDNYEKVGLIGEIVSGHDYISLDYCNNVREALVLLREKSFDILIVDMVLPKVLGEQPNSSAGAELIDILFNNNNNTYNIPLEILAVTCHDDAFLLNEKRMESFGIAFLLTGSSADKLRVILNNKIRYCLSYKSNASASLCDGNSLGEPENITIKWLLAHVKLSQWVAFFSILLAIFVAGFNVSKLEFGKAPPKEISVKSNTSSS